MRSFHSPHLCIAHIMIPMKQRVEAEHLSYQLFVDGPRDPNTRGHILAGQLLLRQLNALWKRYPLSTPPKP